jgi:hypothetical protein
LSRGGEQGGTSPVPGQVVLLAQALRQEAGDQQAERFERGPQRDRHGRAQDRFGHLAGGVGHDDLAACKPRTLVGLEIAEAAGQDGRR